MSRILSLADRITEYGGNLHLPWIPLHLPGIDPATGREFTGKQPLAAALRSTHGSLKPYRDSNPSIEQQLMWCADLSQDLGGRGFNPGIITGHNSVDPDKALYVLDLDHIDTLPDIARDFNTTTIRTGNGFHLWFLGQAGAYLSNRNLRLPDGTLCEFKGCEDLIVAPPGLHASGRRYEPLPGYDIDRIRRLSDFPFVTEGLLMKRAIAQSDTLLRGKQLPINARGRLCLEQIWGRELQAPGTKGKGEREVALYILWQRGRTLRNSPEQMQKALTWKNEKVQPPLKPGEIEAIMREPLEQDKPGNRHGPVGCRFTREALPWVRCERCVHGG
jgi:hypothetical protein